MNIGAILEAIEKRDGDGMIVLSESKLENLAAHCRQQAERIKELEEFVNSVSPNYRAEYKAQLESEAQKRIAELEAVRAHYADEENWTSDGDVQSGFTAEQYVYTPNGHGYEVAQKAAKEKGK